MVVQPLEKVANLFETITYWFRKGKSTMNTDLNIELSTATQ